MLIVRVYIIWYWLDMTKGGVDVYGLQNVIWPGFSSQLSSRQSIIKCWLLWFLVFIKLIQLADPPKYKTSTLNIVGASASQTSHFTQMWWNLKAFPIRHSIVGNASTHSVFQICVVLVTNMFSSKLQDPISIGLWDIDISKLDFIPPRQMMSKNYRKQWFFKNSLQKNEAKHHPNFLIYCEQKYALSNKPSFMFISGVIQRQSAPKLRVKCGFSHFQPLISQQSYYSMHWYY